MTLAASIAIALAILFDAYGLLPRWLADRLAAVLVLFAAGYFLLGSWVTDTTIRLGQQFAHWLAAELRQPLGPKVSEAIGLYALGLTVFVLFVVWLAMLLPKKAQKITGEIVHKELSSPWIWIPPVAFTLGAAFVPGSLGMFVRGTIGLLTNFGQAIGAGLA